jgi:hypothetical protein
VQTQWIAARLAQGGEGIKPAQKANGEARIFIGEAVLVGHFSSSNTNIQFDIGIADKMKSSALRLSGIAPTGLAGRKWSQQTQLPKKQP